MTTEKMSLFTDGACRGNPGPASIGVHAVDSHGKSIFQISQYIGANLTNNIAEYRAIIAALDRAIQENMPHVEIVSDSELAVKQLNGQYKVKNPNIKPLYVQIMQLKDRFIDLTFRHVKREGNKQADALANQALDRELHQ